MLAKIRFCFFAFSHEDFVINSQILLSERLLPSTGLPVISGHFIISGFFSELLKCVLAMLIIIS